MIKQNQKYFNISLFIIDAAIISIALILAYYIRFHTGWFSLDKDYLPFLDYMHPLLYTIPIYIRLYAMFNLYKPHRSNKMIIEFFSIFKTHIVGIGILLSILYITKNIHYSRIVLFLFGILGFVLGCLERLFIRLFLRHIRKKGYNQKHVIIVGYSHFTEEYIRLINSNPQWGYHIIGILDNHKKLHYIYSGIEVIDTVNALPSLLEEKLIDEVVIALKIQDYEFLGDTIHICEKSGVFTRIIPDYFKFISNKPHIENINGLPVISIREVPLKNTFKRVYKRLIDLIGALAALLIFSPIMLIITGVIKLSSSGPVLFKQTRVGLNKKPFHMYKFRSMKVQKESASNQIWTTNNDPRITSIGRFIRKTSLDELPQLFNVIKGDMSLIGPRPERPFYVDKFKEEIPKYMIKHLVRPGITGWAQVNGWRGDTSIRRRIEYDIYYIENWSFKMDVKIAFMTVLKGFINRNAY